MLISDVEIINYHQLALNESFTLGSEARQNVLNSGLRVANVQSGNTRLSSVETQYCSSGGGL